MRKITPMILVTLMLVSALSSFDFAELEETEVIEDAGARAGADAEVVAITNPKETVCPLEATCRNVMKVGDVTEFTSYIKNSGDTDITNMAYSVDVWTFPMRLGTQVNGGQRSFLELIWLGPTTMSSALQAAVVPINPLLPVTSLVVGSTQCLISVLLFYGLLLKDCTSLK